MKFEQRYPDGGEHSFGHTKIVRDKLGACDHCQSFTRWKDTTLNKQVCSEECGTELWRQSASDDPEVVRQSNYALYGNQIKEELELAANWMDNNVATKDIIIVVRDQLDYVKNCLKSIKEHTTDYQLFVWDNASDKPTHDYLEKLALDGEIELLMWSDKNLGFIKPNNELVDWGNGDYIILLNSDTIVFEGWDSAMIAFLQTHEDVGIVGQLGGMLDETGLGIDSGFGYDIDYIMGWCLCLSRDTYEEHGLFNKQLTFAYCEDADLSLRIKEAGLKVYALHAPLVHHYGSKTIKKVSEEGEVDVKKTFDLNHKYMQMRWKEYLGRNRVKLKHGRPKITI